MINSSPDKNKNYNSNFRIIYLVLLLITTIAIGMCVFPSQYIYPRFEKQLLNTVENDAGRTAKHLTQTVLERYSGGKFVISDEIKTYLNNARINYNLWKIKIFSRSGETIYSTSQEEIGEIHKNASLYDIVQKNKSYSKLVKINTRNLERQLVDADMVETYVPIMKGNDFIGAFTFYHDITAPKKSVDALIFQFNLLLYISAIIIINVVVLAALIYRDSMKERKKFEHTILKMANTDELTGLYNRRGFEELLQWEYRRIQRYYRKACILLFDLDHFKNVNDTYGHPAGDNVLAAVAQKCKKVLRKSDIVGRYGGEEFIALLPDTNRLSALKVAEKLRRAVESAPISTSDGAINITISIGIAYFGDKHVLSVDRVIKYADDSLYIAKRNGRNQIFCAQVNAYIERGKAYGRKGQHDKAISEFNKAIEISPKYASAYTNRGIAYSNKGHFDKAISDYNAAIKINPRLAEAYTHRGVAYGRKGQHHKEVADYNKAIEISPRYAKAYFNRGAAASRRGGHDEAIADYNTAIEISPKYAAAYANRGIAYYYKNEYDHAWQDVHKMQELGHKIEPKFLKMLRKASGEDK